MKQATLFDGMRAVPTPVGVNLRTRYTVLVYHPPSPRPWG